MIRNRVREQVGDGSYLYGLLIGKNDTAEMFVDCGIG